MKDPRQERLRHLQREYHRKHPWGLNAGGLYVPHSYAETLPDALSWWDDVGFILNRRRVIVWWRHPRDMYRNTVVELARAQAGEFPLDDWLLNGATPNYRQVGRSRKKIVSYTCRPPSEASRAYFQGRRTAEEELSEQGVDCDVYPSANRTRQWWATGLDLVAPLEVRNEQELAAVADLARRLLLGQTTLAQEFPGYCYTKERWLAEAPARSAQRS
jgi:hypothetical protein